MANACSTVPIEKQALDKACLCFLPLTPDFMTNTVFVCVQPLPYKLDKRNIAHARKVRCGECKTFIFNYSVPHWESKERSKRRSCKEDCFNIDCSVRLRPNKHVFQSSFLSCTYLNNKTHTTEIVEALAAGPWSCEQLSLRTSGVLQLWHQGFFSTHYDVLYGATTLSTSHSPTKEEVVFQLKVSQRLLLLARSCLNTVLSKFQRKEAYALLDQVVEVRLRTSVTLPHKYDIRFACGIRRKISFRYYLYLYIVS